MKCLRASLTLVKLEGGLRLYTKSFGDDPESVTRKAEGLEPSARSYLMMDDKWSTERRESTLRTPDVV